MDKLSFMRESINDIQLTIRAIDVKAGFFLVFLCLPLSQMDKITSGFKALLEHDKFWIFLIGFNFILWFLALILVVISVFPLNNPNLSVNFDGQTTHPKGFYFGGYLFGALAKPSAFNPNHVPISNVKFVDEKAFIALLDDEKISEELLFERMKLICIRDLKIKRLQKSLFVTIGWIVLSFVTWIAVISI